MYQVCTCNKELTGGNPSCPVHGIMPPTQMYISECSNCEKLIAENERLRMLLWLRHGCSALYGDDGEMQCGHCRIDFKRDTAESIEQKWYVAGYEALKR